MPARIRIKVDDSRFRQALKRLARLAGDLRPTLDAIGFLVAGQTRRRFDEGLAPSGRRWKQSGRAEAQGGQTLLDTGRLRDSIAHRLRGAKAVDIGTNVRYAAIHQFGGEITPKTAKVLRFRVPGGGWVSKGRVRIPARPYLGLNRRDIQDIQNLVRRRLARAAGGRAA